MDGFDAKDRAMLYELERDARVPISAMAKKLRLSKQVAFYRLGRLIKSGAIVGFYTVVNAAKLGYSDFEIWFRLSDASEGGLEKVLGVLKGWLYSRWVAKCGLGFDVGYGLYARNAVHFNAQLNELLGLFGDNVSSYEYSSIVEIDNFSVAALSKVMAERKMKVHFGDEPRKEKLSQNEAKVLKAVSQDARARIVDLAKKLGLSEKAAKMNLAELERRKIITGFRAVPRFSKLGLLNFELLFALSPSGKGRLVELKRYCASHPSVTYMISSIGKWQATVAIVVKNQDEFDVVFSEIRGSFRDIIRDCEIVLVKEFVKFNYLPPIE